MEANSKTTWIRDISEPCEDLIEHVEAAEQADTIPTAELIPGEVRHLGIPS
jgi:hypothetical protein